MAAAMEPAVQSAFLGPFPGARGITAEDDAEVRLVDVPVELPHEPGRYPVQTLQDQRRRQVAVTDHEPPGLQRRADLVLKVLVAVGSYQACQCQTAVVVGAEAGQAAERCRRGLFRRHNGAAVSYEPTGQQPGERALADAARPVDGDK